MFLRKKKKNDFDKEKKERNSFDEEPEVDSEGYTIKKDVDISYNQKKLDKFYSSSDESDSEKETEKKLKFVIKPRNGFELKKDSVDELKETVKQLSLAPPSTTKKQIDHLRNRLKRRQITLNNNAIRENDGTLKRSTSQNVINNNRNMKLSFYNKNSNFNCSLSNLPVSFNNEEVLKNILNLNSKNNSIKNEKSTDITNNKEPSNFSEFKVPTLKNVNEKASVSSNTQKPTEDRYAALRAFFDDENKEDLKDVKSVFNQDSNLVKSTSLSKSISSFAGMVPNTSSKNSVSQTVTNGRHSIVNLISRCESYSSLSTDLRMTPVSICSSRGPSPLTLGSSIPIAAAIQECVSACFKGSDESKCNSVIYGILKIAFPTGILQILMNQPLVNVLKFKLYNASRISKINCNKEVILRYNKEETNKTNSEIHFEVNMEGLIQSLKKSFEKSPAARYFNVDILKYQLQTSPGIQSCPLQVVTHWKCEPQTTCLKIDYKYNPYALSSLEPLKNVSFTVKLDANVLDFQSKPKAEWNPITKQVCWKIDQISRLSEGHGLGSLRAKFSVTKGPLNPSPVIIQLNCSNSTFSGVNFELLTNSYRISVVKKQVSAGHYISEADSTISYASV